MSTLRNLFSRPIVHLSILTGMTTLVFVRSQIVPQDDHFNYQQFIESLANGIVDFSIPGFHGGSFLALPLHLLWPTDLTNIYLQILCGILLVPAAYGAAKTLLKNKVQALLFAYSIACMPFLSFMSLRGFTFASFTLCIFLSLWLIGKESKLAWIPLGISMTIKPFSVALLPLLFCHPGATQRTTKKALTQVTLALAIPVLYVIAEYLQIGRIIVGSHIEMDQSNVFVWSRLPLNAAHGIQMLFSVHNFYFPDPAKTGFGNLTHGSPVLMVLGTLSLLYFKDFWKNHRLGLGLLLSTIIAFLLASALDHMDHFYLETVTILLTLGSIPLLSRYTLLIPLALATLHFQFFYLYLQYRNVFFLDYSLFWIVGVVDIMALLNAVLLWKKT